MERFLARENLSLALRRVERNAGTPGIDGMGHKRAAVFARAHSPEIRSALDAGTSRPQPVRRVTIPNPSCWHPQWALAALAHRRLAVLQGALPNASWVTRASRYSPVRICFRVTTPTAGCGPSRPAA